MRLLIAVHVCHRGVDTFSASDVNRKYSAICGGKCGADLKHISVLFRRADETEDEGPPKELDFVGSVRPRRRQ